MRYDNVETGDLFLYAGTNIGTASNYFDIQVGGDLSGVVGQDAFINSSVDLNITTFTSSSGDVTLTVDGASAWEAIRVKK